MTKKKGKNKLCKVTYLEADRRRKIIYEMWTQGLHYKEITKRINKIYTNRAGKPYSESTIRKDIHDIKAGLVETAQEMLGNQKVVIANFVQRALRTRAEAIEQGDLGLVYRIDKDILKLVGVNLDAVNLNVAFGADEETNQPITFFDLVRSIREQKGLKKIEPGEL